MADWKVSAERIEIFEHPNAEAMDIAKVGVLSLVVAKAKGFNLALKIVASDFKDNDDALS